MIRRILAALMMTSTVAFAQPCGDWLRGVGTPGVPPGTIIVDMFQDPSSGAVYLASRNRVFQLIDGEWESIAEHQQLSSIDSIFSINDEVYVTATLYYPFPDDITIREAYRLVDGSLASEGWSTPIPGVVAVADGVAYVVGYGSLTRISDSGVTEMPSPGDVRALTVMNGELYAGGTFNNASGRYISKWNGTAWQPVGTAGSGPNNWVFGLSSYRPDSTASSERLIVTGEFSACGATPTNRIAELRQDGTWAALGSGITAPSGSSGTSWNFASLPVAPGDTDLVVGTAMISGTQAGQVLRWTGTTWQTYGTPSGPVYGVAYDGGIIAGGSFTQISGVSAVGVARRADATWAVMGTGTDGAVRDLLVHNGVLYACGDFTSIEGVPASRVAYRDATGWHAMSTGMNGVVRGFIVHNGLLHAYGDFTTAGGSGLIGIAQWNGSIWIAPWSPINVGQVADACSWNGQLVICGTLTSQVGSRISRLNAGTWTSVPTDSTGVVTSVESFLGSLYAAGQFTRLGGSLFSSQQNIARWSGSAWEYLGSSTLTNGVNGRVNDLRVYAGSLYAGGLFTQAGGLSATGLARWDGGAFSAVPGVSTSSPTVSGLDVIGSRLVVTGSLRVCPIGDSCVTPGVVAWDGSDWQRFAGEDSFSVGGGSPVAAAEFEGDIVVGGDFTERYAVGASYIARWSPDIVVRSLPRTTDVCLGQTAAMSIRMATSAEYTYQWKKNGVDMVNGGRVTGAQGSVLQISGAQFGDTGVYSCAVTNDCGVFESPGAQLTVRTGPSLSQLSPSVVQVTSGGVATVRYALASTTSSTMRWYHNDLPVSDGAGGASVGGGVVSGSAGPTLRITGARTSDSGVYFATVTNLCGDATGATFVVLVESSCEWEATGCFADYDASGGVDSDDVIAFFGEWDAGGSCADVDGSGGTDSDDVIGFFTAWDAGGVGYPGC